MTKSQSPITRRANKPAKDQPKETEEQEPADDGETGPHLEYKLGKAKVDGDHGDAGYLLKAKQPVPQAYFVSSLYCAKNGGHTSRQLKKVMITTSFVIAYQKLKIVEVYAIQPCSNSSVPKDYTYEHFQQQFMKRKNDEKKKKENTLAALIKAAQQDTQQQQESEANKAPDGESEDKQATPILTFTTLFAIQTSE
jgi:hypothetical protein